MAAPPQGSVFPNHRLSPSGPQLSGEGGPIIQIGFDQCIFTDPLKASWEVQRDLNDPFDAADICANAIIARDVSLTDGGPPPSVTNIPKSNRMGVTLKGVKKDSLIGAWFSFGISTDVLGFVMAAALCAEDGDGNQAPVGFSNQTVVEAGTPSGSNAIGSVVTLQPNPTGIVSDITVYPVMFTQDLKVVIFPALNQVALMVAEFAKT